jgi:hypothetical protein
MMYERLMPKFEPPRDQGGQTEKKTAKQSLSKEPDKQIDGLENIRIVPAPTPEGTPDFSNQERSEQSQEAELLHLRPGDYALQILTLEHLTHTDKASAAVSSLVEENSIDFAILDHAIDKHREENTTSDVQTEYTDWEASIRSRVRNLSQDQSMQAETRKELLAGLGIFSRAENIQPEEIRNVPDKILETLFNTDEKDESGNTLIKSDQAKVIRQIFKVAEAGAIDERTRTQNRVTNLKRYLEHGAIEEIGMYTGGNLLGKVEEYLVGGYHNLQTNREAFLKASVPEVEALEDALKGEQTQTTNPALQETREYLNQLEKFMAVTKTQDKHENIAGDPNTEKEKEEHPIVIDDTIDALREKAPAINPQAAYYFTHNAIANYLNRAEPGEPKGLSEYSVKAENGKLHITYTEITKANGTAPHPETAEATFINSEEGNGLIMESVTQNGDEIHTESVLDVQTQLINKINTDVASRDVKLAALYLKRDRLIGRFKDEDEDKKRSTIAPGA